MILTYLVSCSDLCDCVRYGVLTRQCVYDCGGLMMTIYTLHSTTTHSPTDSLHMIQFYTYNTQRTYST